MDLSCLFVNFNSWRWLARALESLCASPPTGSYGVPLAFEVVVVDNASTEVDGAARAAVERVVAGVGGAVLDAPQNGGYGAGMNLAMARARGRLLLCSNPDVRFAPGAVTELVACFRGCPDLGAVEPAVYGDAGFAVQMPAHVVPTVADLLRAAWGTVSLRGNRRYSERRTRAALRVWQAEGDVELPMFGGCCFLTSREVLARVGGFDERYPLYFEDTDLALRMVSAGLRLVRCRAARVVHFYDRSAATGRADALARQVVSRRRFFARWYGWRGRVALRLVTRCLASRLGRRRAALVAARPMRRVELQAGRPVLVLPRPCQRFLVEIAYEPFLFLAAAAFGSGARWCPDADTAAVLRDEVWFRVVDLDGGRREELGIWHHCAADAARS
jgi:N-acetylglucosaminyl-diphospho-decaprenol L-rhamnosyltransferase